MPPPLVLPLQDCTDPVLVGGKAVGLARLLAAGFSVPHGFCVTTEAYRHHLHRTCFNGDERWRHISRAGEEDRRAALVECRTCIAKLDLSELTAECAGRMAKVDPLLHGRWAVRSSATNEDAARASFAGIYRTRLGVAPTDVEEAIKDLWASVWDERVVQYIVQSKRGPNDVPAMAVVIQPMLEAFSAGVAYSIHPVTGRSNQVAVNAVLGLAAPLVDGNAAPDQYVVEVSDKGQPVGIRNRVVANKLERLVVADEGLRRDPIPKTARTQCALTDDQAFELARTVKQVERVFHYPVDIEWAIDSRHLWLLQARPITAVRPSSELTNDDCEWSRANFKETMPEVPSPLGLSFLEYFMEMYIVAHYRRLGCRIPEGLSAVRTGHGRPYLNVTLFHSLVGQLGGDPSLNVEQMGGEPLQSKPAITKLGWPRLIRAGWLMSRELRRVTQSGSRWFAEMKELAATYHPDRIRNLSLDDLASHLDELGRWLDHREITFGIAAGVGQCLQTFNSILPPWLGEDWRPLLNQALQGQGTVISAQQIIRLAELVQLARENDALSVALLKQPWDLAALRRQAPGAAFLDAFDRYLEEYGHRGVGESDIMSPRFSDQPDALLDVIRAQLRGPASSPADVLPRQRATSAAALTTIRSRFRWRLDRWIIFLWWYRRLCRFSALREANRHHLMHYSTAVRHLLLQFGQRLSELGILASLEDVFFLTMEERASVLSDHTRDWVALIRSRRADRERWLAMQVPDTIRDWREADGIGTPMSAVHDESPRLLRGIPISVGSVTGPAKLVRSTSDWSRVRAGDIIVAPVIDPGMAPLFGLAAGIVVEMGGTLSHGAIIVREYGLPAVANVAHVMSLLKDDDVIRLHAGSGDVIRQSVSGH